MIKIHQKNNPIIEFDNRHTKSIILWQTNENAESIVIDRERISDLIELLKNEIHYENNSNENKTRVS